MENMAEALGTSSIQVHAVAPFEDIPQSARTSPRAKNGTRSPLWHRQAAHGHNWNLGPPTALPGQRTLRSMLGLVIASVALRPSPPAANNRCGNTGPRPLDYLERAWNCTGNAHGAAASVPARDRGGRSCNCTEMGTAAVEIRRRRVASGNTPHGRTLQRRCILGAPGDRGTLPVAGTSDCYTVSFMTPSGRETGATPVVL